MKSGRVSFIPLGLRLNEIVARRGRSICRGAKVPESVRRYLQSVGGEARGLVALNRVLVSGDEVSDGLVTLDGEDLRAWHVRNILKVEDGGRIRAGVVDGELFDEAEVTLGEDGGIRLELGAGVLVDDVPRVDVLLALPRPGVMSRMWSALASLGVGNIFVVNAYRVEKTYFSSKVMREDEIREALVAGLMQSGCDSRVPNVVISKQLKKFLTDELDKHTPREALRVVGHPGSDLKRLSQMNLGDVKRILVAIGPVS